MDRNPLLPPDAPPPLEDGGDEIPESPDAIRPTWASVKGAVTRFTRSHKRGPDARSAIAGIGSRYVGAQGGARRAAQSAGAGRRSALNLAAFLGDVSSGGVDSALRDRGLVATQGRSVDFLLDQLLNTLAPVGESLEEGIARVAMAKTLDEMFESAGEAGELATLDQLSEREIVGILEIYLAHYINTRLMQALSERNEVKSPAASDAAAIEVDIKSYVRELVALDMSELDTSVGTVLQMDWAGHEGRAFIDRIFVEAYKLLEEGK